MKNKQKVWIRGVEGRGDEVLNALKALGGKLTHGSRLSGEDDTCIYSITHKGFICTIPAEHEVGKIVMDCYREIKLSEQWKDGDILFSEIDNEFAVFKHECKINSISTDSFFCHLITWNGLCSTYQVVLKIDFRLATKSEVAQFHKRLHAIKKDWDAEKKQLVDWQWKPEPREIYYFVNETGEAASTEWTNVGYDECCYQFGNCFRTKEEAEVASERIRKALKGGEK